MRMSTLLGENVGETVGFQTRDERRIGARTRIEVLTEGVLTRRLQHDPTLEGTALVIFDEVHERNLPTDTGLAFLLDAIVTWDAPTKVLAMSATAQSDLFAQVLADSGENAPVVFSDGKIFPVDVRYVPRQKDSRIENSVVDTALTALRDDEGDILVFLPGIAEINRTQSLLQEKVGDHVDVVRLAGALPFEEQDAALRPSSAGKRRVVLSTDIAETSLTVEGVHIVIDAGLARTPRLDPRTGLTEIVTITSSRASAEQRSGRAGRVRPGVAYRLWSRIEDATRLAHLPSEITQTDLTGLALEIAAWGTPIETLRFLDAPPEKTIRMAIETLRTLHLVDDLGAITDLGRQVLTLPLHPRLGTMVARHRDDPAQGWIACILAALLDERDIMRGRPDDSPCDISLRVKAVTDLESHDLIDRGALRRVQHSARDIARRASITAQTFVSVDVIDKICGPILLSAYPDRLAMRRSSAGQFVMRSGGAVHCDNKDSLAKEQFIVAADINAQRGTARLRRAAAVDLDVIAPVLGDDVEVESYLLWDKQSDDLVQRVVRKVGNIRIDERDLTPVAGADTTEALIDRVRSTTFGCLSGGAALQFRQRIACVRHHLGDSWPDTSQKHLLSTIEEWLTPYLVGATGRKDLAAIDLTMILQAELGWDRSTQLDELVPGFFSPPRGRDTEINYADPTAPTVAIRVQHLYGVTQHPTVMNGALPLRLQLLSPADRPIQVTSDLPGFWSGSWAEVRKEMAGRYPKHDWPIQPSL
jgi:ATP-dependent helicase HrpB